MDTTRMPVMDLSEFQESKTNLFIGETEFVHPDNEQEQVKIYIYMAKPDFNNEQLQVSFHLF